MQLLTPKPKSNQTRRKKAKETNKNVKKANDNTEKTTLGDIQALADLRDELHKSENE